MAIARVSVLEFNSPESAKNFQRSQKEMREKVFPNLKMILAHLGHPWQDYCMSVVRKHKNVYADLSAQFYRPWSFWQGMNLFNEWGVLDKVFFGSDWPVTTPDQTLNGINNLNNYAEKFNLPNFSEEILKNIIKRDVINLLEINI